MSDTLLDLLVCPACRGSLRHLFGDTPEASDAAGAATQTGTLAGLACDACEVVYPLEDGIPVLLTEEARPLRA